MLRVCRKIHCCFFGWTGCGNINRNQLDSKLSSASVAGRVQRSTLAVELSSREQNRLEHPILLWHPDIAWYTQWEELIGGLWMRFEEPRESVLAVAVNAVHS